MKMVLFLLVSIQSFVASADCDAKITQGEKEYCLEYEWLPAQRRVQGVFQDDADGAMSPVLNRQGTPPPRWLYSQARVLITNLDGTIATDLEAFRVFPYMIMANGHHHSTNHFWEYSAVGGPYILSAMALQEMVGCWSMRYSFAGGLGSHLFDLIDYSNLDKEEDQLKVIEMCSTYSGIGL
jgi:hypothetical protein